MNERVVVFGSDRHLVGTLIHAQRSTAAPGQSDAGLAVLTFNAGLIPRTGPHRLWVKLSRQLARNGISSLRFDLSGQGDSGTAEAADDFEAQSIADIRCAMSEVQAQTGIDRFALIGVCSGAALSYKTALADPRVVACAMLDVYMYSTWQTHWVLLRGRVQKVGMTRYLAEKLQRVATRFGWPGSAMPPAGKAASRLPGLLRPSADDFAAGLQQLLDRGTKLLMIYTGSFFNRYNHDSQFHDRFRRYRITGPLHVEFIPEIDHTVTEQSAQHAMIDKLTRWLQ